MTTSFIVLINYIEVWSILQFFFIRFEWIYTFLYMTCYIKKTIPCTSMPIAISPHTKGAILSSPAELTVNTLKVNVLCITRNEELLKKLKKNKKKPTTSNSQFMKSTLFYWTFFYLCKKIKITNSNKQDWWGEQQFSRTNVTFAIHVNVLNMVV